MHAMAAFSIFVHFGNGGSGGVWLPIGCGAVTFRESCRAAADCFGAQGHEWYRGDSGPRVAFLRMRGLSWPSSRVFWNRDLPARFLPAVLTRVPSVCFSGSTSCM